MSRVTELFARIAEVDRPEIFLALRTPDEIEADLDASLAAGGPLAGRLLAVKDNVDVVGLPTTAACPEYSSLPDDDAACVAALRAAGAVVVGKTNLDQFATGLVGTRSPYGAVRDARDPARISGGSSSGSAVAVALGLVDLAIGTDTAGSGRIPAALQGIVGVKPTVGVVSTDGVVPACASYDTVTIFAADLDLADRATAALAAAAGDRPFGAAPLAAPGRPVLAVPAELPELDDAWRAAFTAAVGRAEAAGMQIKTVDPSSFLAAARLLYDDALVSERYDAVGAFLDEANARGAAGLDPTVTAIVSAAASYDAVDLLRARRKLADLRREAMAQLDGVDALLVPTAPCHPTLAEVAADPVGVNARMGTYTNFCNLFDLCGVAVPAGSVAADPAAGPAPFFGVTFLALAHRDAVVMDLARRFAGTPDSGPTWPESAGAPAVELAVFGAHMRGGPLTHELSDRGARWSGEVVTAPSYRLVALDTVPPKPGLIRDPSRGRAIRGETWSVPPAALGEFLAALPAPMMLGKVELDDGRQVVGFGCAADAGDTGTPLDRDRW
ncbi:MAG: allophanate hydrolase [Gordonia sp. (in: high G+C Gram-positive bacteria)]|uniref:allophanate hydrolase n=1 Tax=Gordonia sp. (in: high G+C Gram-positive bacteria) TaxID=84139 RepID=UPI0039E4A7CF